MPTFGPRALHVLIPFETVPVIEMTNAPGVGIQLRDAAIAAY